MAIGAPPGTGRARESVSVCVREREEEGETACGAGGGEGEGEGARLCAAASGESERAAGSPRVSRQRGVARHGQKVSSALQGSVAAGGGGNAMPGWEGTEIPLRERFKAISAWRWPEGEGCDSPPWAECCEAPRAPQPPAEPLGGRRAPTCPRCRRPPTRAALVAARPRRSRPEAAAEASGSLSAPSPLQHRGQRRAPRRAGSAAPAPRRGGGPRSAARSRPRPRGPRGPTAPTATLRPFGAGARRGGCG